jgi:hypothetical protein
MEVKVTGKLEIEQKGKAGKQENTTMQDELLKQLHEQYAVNNNANLGTIVTLVVAVIAVIGYFGYVYVHTGVEFSEDFGCLIAEEVNGVNVYYLDALLLIYLASVLVIAILIRLCIYQGVAQRKEQFIIHAIRCKYFKDGLNKEDYIFPEGYTPYKKERLQIVQGLYGELVKIFKSVFWILTAGIALKLAANVFGYFFLYPPSWKSISGLGLTELLVAILTVIGLATWGIIHYCNQICGYKKRQREYLGLPMLEKDQEQPKVCKICKFLKQQSEACKADIKTNQDKPNK